MRRDWRVNLGAIGLGLALAAPPMNGALAQTGAGTGTKPSLVVYAHGAPAAGVWPIGAVFVNDAFVGSFTADTATAKAFTIPVYSLPKGAKVDIVFTNDAWLVQTGQGDRNLYVDKTVINGATVLPTDPGVYVDGSDGEDQYVGAPFDGKHTYRTTGEISGYGALRMIAPVGAADTPPPAPTLAKPSLVVRAAGTKTDGLWPVVDVYVNGKIAGGFVVRSRNATDYTVPVTSIPLGAKVDVVTQSIAWDWTHYSPPKQTRSLTIEKVTINGETQTTDAPDAMIVLNNLSLPLDFGRGPAESWWVQRPQRPLQENGTVRFVAHVGAVDAPPPAPPPAPAPWTEQILTSSGQIDWTAYTRIAKNYNKELDYRLGPRAADYGAALTSRTIYQPDPQGLWKGGAKPWLADVFCQPPNKLIASDAPDAYGSDADGSYGGGGGWQMSGQMLFLPDASPKEQRFTLGSANMRNFDGARAARASDGSTQALCMRMRAEWIYDWWNRNDISTPATPNTQRALHTHANLALPPVATARGQAQASVAGFLAFADGWIVEASTGNDFSCHPFTGSAGCKTAIKLPAGKVPTALALTAMNEFLFATVWDTVNRKGQLAVIAVGPNDPASIGRSGTGRDGWGVQSWPNIRALKLLGFVDLPMAAPSSLSVSLSTGSEKFRGYDQWTEDLGKQSVRDAWFKRSGSGNYGSDQQFKMLADAGVAIVASRAENKVAFVDLKPLLDFYREMYLTTPENYALTANSRQGTGDKAWPFTFVGAPKQIPTIAKVFNVPQPTAVYARQRSSGTNSRAYDESGGAPQGGAVFQRYAYVASMDGSVRRYDVSSLVNLPTNDRIAIAPLTEVKLPINVGRNPVQLTGPIASDGRKDDVFAVSRVDRKITVLNWKGELLKSDRGEDAILIDSRLVDPVFVSIGGNTAGYGGSGPGKASWARVLTVLDFDGKTVHDYGMRLFSDATKSGPWDGSSRAEEWPYLGPNGEVQLFQYGFGNKLPGKPFAHTFDEVI